MIIQIHRERAKHIIHDEIVPLDFLPKDRRYSLVVEPLYFQDKSLGYVVFEIGPHDGNTYELLRNNLSSADVLDQMRADPRLRQVPVIVLSNKVLSLEDVKRIEGHTRVTLQSKGIWSEAETVTALNRAIFGTDTLPVHTSALVKQAIAYLHQNYSRSLSRWEIAEAVGVSEDYLSRVFHRELNVSPWDYLNRYRVLQSKQLLVNTTQSVGSIAHQVGFKDQAYFSRVFHKLTGVSPQEFREINLA